MTSEIVRRIPLHHLLIQPDEPPMHLPAVVGLVDGSRIDDRPIEVEPVPGSSYFVIRNGRHRFMAAVALARPDINCVLREEPRSVIRRLRRMTSEADSACTCRGEVACPPGCPVCTGMATVSPLLPCWREDHPTRMPRRW